MKAVIIAAAIAAATAFSAASAAQAAGPHMAPSARVLDTAAPQAIGWRDRRSAYSDYCKPYNGPYGYYGNPYCEGGFTRNGKAGGYEIDLTRYFDGRYWDGERRSRRYR